MLASYALTFEPHAENVFTDQPGGVGGDFGSKGCALVLTCFTEIGFPVSIEDQLLDTPLTLRIVIGFKDYRLVAP